MFNQTQADRVETFLDLARVYPRTLGNDAADEYQRMNAAIGVLTAVRTFLTDASIRAPFETPVKRDARGFPIRDDESGMPRPLYRKAERAVIDAENAIMAIRDRRGWQTTYDRFGRVAAQRER